MRPCDIFILLPPAANITLVSGSYIKTFVCYDLAHGLLPDNKLVDIVCNHILEKIYPLDDMNIILVID